MQEYVSARNEIAISDGTIQGIYGSEDKHGSLAKQLARRDPKYDRNRVRVCISFVKGECKRGAYCPYRHEKPENTELSQQSFKGRYYGTRDPLAESILRSHEFRKQQQLPECTDPSVTSLFVGKIPPSVTENDLRSKFSPYGTISSVRHIKEKGFAFIEFENNEQAQNALKSLFMGLEMQGKMLSINWAKSQDSSKKRSNEGNVPVDKKARHTGDHVYPSENPLQLGSLPKQ